jgi:rubrerythrin
MFGLEELYEEYGEEDLQAMMMDSVQPGICTVCGTIHDGLEPDARRYKCEDCGEPQVFSAMELLYVSD